jgi:hypothetical protein
MCQVARRCRCARDCYVIEAMRPLADFFQTCLSEIGFLKIRCLRGITALERVLVKVCFTTELSLAEKEQTRRKIDE